MLIRTTQVTVAPEDADTFSDERATMISITDDGGGEFVEVSQLCGKIQIDTNEWLFIRQAIDSMMEGCRK